MYFTGVPLFPFGYGLSYKHFTYANLTTSADNLCQASINVSVDVTNSSTRRGRGSSANVREVSGRAVARPK